MDSMKKRIVSIELLRILAMMMVVMLHYLGKGGLLETLTGTITLNGYVAWVMEALCIVAVNVYMLISGYFLVNSNFKVNRLVELICQVMFYSILVEVVLLVTGVISRDVLTINRILELVFPFQMEHYWFMTAYIGMYLFSPILCIGVKCMEQKQLRNTIILLLVFFSVSKSLLPVQLMIDKKGYDCLWFICVFLVAAYIRLYGIPWLEKGKLRGWLCYGIGVSGILLVTFCVRMVYLKTGSLDHFIQSAFHYNHVLNLLAAVGLFYGFLKLRLSAEAKASKVICKVAPYSLGVYLLHEQIDIRYLWPEWLGANVEGNVVGMILRCLMAVFIVYVFGTLVDIVRSVFFKRVSCLFHKFVQKV